MLYVKSLHFISFYTHIYTYAQILQRLVAFDYSLQPLINFVYHNNSEEGHRILEKYITYWKGRYTQTTI